MKPSTGLMDAVKRKGAAVNELQTLEAKRSAVCNEAGFSDGSLQMQSFIDWCDNDALVANCWSRLLELAEECQTINLSNGAIIRVRKQHVEEGIAVLRGSEGSSATYDRDGESREGASQRAIAEA